MIEFRLFGTLHLTDDAGCEVKALLTRSRRLALLAYLAAGTPRGLRRRDSLLALFWPELDQEHARAALRQALHVVRDALGAEAIVTRGDDEVGLDPERIWSDVVAFDRAIASGQLGAALELYRGDLLDGFFIPGAGEFERWLEDARGHFRGAASAAASTLVEQCETAGDLDAAVAWARRALRIGGGIHDEAILRRLIALLDRLGERAVAVQAYDAFAQQLETELETEPSAETKAVLAEVQARAIALPLAVRSPVAGAAPSRGRTMVWSAALAAAAAGLLFSSGGARPGRAWSRSADRVRSLAVLPFANLSGDTLRAWYADGLTEAVTTDLGRIRSLSVMATGAVTPSPLTGKSARAIAQELNVDAIVEGDLQQSGRTVRADIRLISAATGYELWAGRFEEPIQNRFALGDTALLERAWVADEKALRLGPDLAEAHFVRAILFAESTGQVAPGMAIQENRRALELDPNLAQAHHAIGNIYLHYGLLDRAVEEFRRTLAIDPGNFGAPRRIGLALVYRGRYEDGLRMIRQVPAQSNQSLWTYQVAWALLYLGRNDEASTLMERYLRDHPEDRGGVVTSTRAIFFAKTGDARRAEADIRTAIVKGRGFIHFHHTAYNIASAYALLRQTTRALYWLHRAAEGGWPCYPSFARDPNLDRIRGDADFVEFMKQLKQQWQRNEATL